MWTLEEGIELARRLEQKLNRCYRHYHVAIGGSTLHKGLSNKDLDIFIYPHKTCQIDKEWMLNALKEFGFEFKRDCSKTHEIYGDGKEVHETRWNGKRVDLFFLE